MSLEREYATVCHGCPAGYSSLTCGFMVVQIVFSNVFSF